MGILRTDLIIKSKPKHHADFVLGFDLTVKCWLESLKKSAAPLVTVA